MKISYQHLAGQYVQGQHIYLTNYRTLIVMIRLIFTHFV
ncbi:hypothetical protein BGS_1268 [Beggiatoa sp. SS]|nr:hypothetical protein BGS_1268 [Beggiatoa sp. SS]